MADIYISRLFLRRGTLCAFCYPPKQHSANNHHQEEVHSFSRSLRPPWIAGFERCISKASPRQPDSSEHSTATFGILGIQGRMPSSSGYSRSNGSFIFQPTFSFAETLFPLRETMQWILNRRWTHALSCLWRPTFLLLFVCFFGQFHSPIEISQHWKPTSNQKPTVTQNHRVIPDAAEFSIWGHHQVTPKISLVRFTRLKQLQRRVIKLYILKMEATYLASHLTYRRKGIFYCCVRGF